jgi:hypothetical protein
MKRLFEVNFVALFLLVFALSAFGQTNEKIEQELVGHIKNILEWSNYTNRSGENLSEKLFKENEIFKKKLSKYTKRLSTLKYKFPRLAEDINISTSEDGKFRIYSWDTETGGTIHRFENVYQYKGKNGKVYSKSYELSEMEPGGFYTDIFQVKTKKETIYLARFSAILMTSLSYQSIDLFKIENKSLNDKIKLFKTKMGLQNYIGFEYNFFSVVDRPERPIKLILFDKKTKTLEIPVVIEDEKFPNGRVTNKFISYRFNGKYFVKVG